jgi:hypothetical protein
MGDWFGYLQAAAKSKTGLSGGVVIGGLLAAAGFVGTLVWLSITLFIWLAERFDNLTLAGLVLSGVYFLVSVIALATALTVRRLNHRRAEAELQARKAAFSSSLLSSPLLSGGIAPTLLSAGLQVGRTVGWRRLVMMAGVALLTTGLVREWTARSGDDDNDETADDPPVEP